MAGLLGSVKIASPLDENGSVLVAVRESFRLLWRTLTDWNKGTIPATVDIVGTGDDAVVTLKAKSDDTANIPYTTPSNYVLSDAAKVEVATGHGRLKTLSGSSEDWIFTTPANYTYDSDLMEVADGVAKLTDQRPALATFYCSFDFKDGNWGDGFLPGVIKNAATVSGGRLNVSGGVGKSCEYDGGDNAKATLVGAARFGYIPKYSGSPSDYQVMFFLGTNATFNNSIYIYHDLSGVIYLAMYDNSSTLIMAANLGSWSPTAGVEYEFEYNWNIVAGATRLFIDGVQHGSTAVQTGTHVAFDIIRIGNNFANALTSNFEINYFLLFSLPQHTANYTPAGQYGISSTIFPASAPTIEPVTPFVFTAAMNAFTETATTPNPTAVNYQVTSDDGATWKWWSGAAWVARSALMNNIPSAVRTVTGTLDSGDLASIQSLGGAAYSVSEVAGAPGFLIEIDYAEVVNAPSTITLHAAYNGNPSHTVNVDIWNFQTSGWDTLGQIPSSGVIITQYDFTVTGTPSDYLEEGAVNIRVNHTTAGNTGHDIFLDFCPAEGAASNKWWNDNESNTAAEVHTNIGTLAASGTFNFLAFLDGVVTDETPELDRITAAEPTTYSTEDNLYIDTGLSQVAPAAPVSWISTLLSNNKPASTDIRVLFSVDGKVTWLAWSGAAWAAPASATTRTDATSILNATLFFSALPIGDGTLDARVFLKTDAIGSSPDIDNIRVVSNEGFDTSGTYETNIVDSEFISLDWGVVEFVQTLPGGTTMMIKVKASNTASDMGVYGAVLVNGEDSGVEGQFVQFEVVMGGVPLARPTLNALGIQFVTPQTRSISP